MVVFYILKNYSRLISLKIAQFILINIGWLEFEIQHWRFVLKLGYFFVLFISSIRWLTILLFNLVVTGKEVTFLKVIK